MVDLLGTGLNGITTVAAAFGGFLLAGWNQRRGDERAAERERAQHARDVATRLSEERHHDQLTLLRTLQEEIQEVVRNTGRIIGWDATLVHESADSSALPGDLNRNDQDARARLAMHLSRVLDDEVRLAVENMASELSKLVLPSLVLQKVTMEQAEAETARRFTALADLSTRTLALVGIAVRTEARWAPPEAQG